MVTSNHNGISVTSNLNVLGMHATAGHWGWRLELQVEETDIALFKYGPRENNNNEKSYT